MVEQDGRKGVQMEISRTETVKIRLELGRIMSEEDGKLLESAEVERMVYS